MGITCERSSRILAPNEFGQFVRIIVHNHVNRISRFGMKCNRVGLSHINRLYGAFIAA